MSATTPTELITAALSATAAAASSTDSASAEDGSNGNAIEATTTSTVPVQITNAFSLAACVCVVVSYFIFRRKNKRIMERPSLILAVSMAAADGLLHCINEFGYTDLPHNFVCSFFGGFLYAFPTLISVFYSFCIALNTMLVFVFSKRPGNSTLKYYVGIPIALSALICIPALGAGVYGYDATYDLCWIASDETTSPNQVVTRYLLTFGLWCLVTMVFLIFAAILISHSVFAKTSKLNKLASGLSKALPSSQPISSGSGPHPISRYSTFYTTNSNNNNISGNDNGNGDGNGQDVPVISYARPMSAYAPGQVQEPQTAGIGSLKSEFESEPPTPSRFRSAVSVLYSSNNQGAAASKPPAPPVPAPRQENTTLTRRSQAMRALAFRLLGYILIPTICILPGVTIDLITKVSPTAAANIPDSLNTAFDTLNGLVGLFNAILYAMDPALLALYHQMRMARREKEMLYGNANGGNGGRVRAGVDVEMAATRADATVYTTPPESPGLDTPSGFDWAEHTEKDSQIPPLPTESVPAGAAGAPGAEPGRYSAEAANETKVEVRAGKFLSPLRINGKGKKSERGLPSPRPPPNPNTNSSGIMITVNVQVNNDQELELARLERYLGGL
ncbi:hypothetical protein M408DRAFT_22441 [Serendipita vermifera MAFF 305830]|uniref:G-protein coupled receptors family 2 profile 2 domain-containing protein n=1 Tax=Serendipita vermifera MAFF 305830 TaxID=933852 RepID=A0A0C3AZS3_SERVB|nr:hypothetical protein M408DRAFT_22441 [Serendipita vermifera MAFF 305830]